MFWDYGFYQTLSGRILTGQLVSGTEVTFSSFSTKTPWHVSTLHSFPSGVNRKKVWVGGAPRQNLNARRQGPSRSQEGKEEVMRRKGPRHNKFCQTINETNEALNKPPLLKEIHVFFSPFSGWCLPFFQLLSHQDLLPGGALTGTLTGIGQGCPVSFYGRMFPHLTPAQHPCATLCVSHVRLLMERIHGRGQSVGVKGQILYRLYSSWGCHEALLSVVIRSFPLKTGHKINVNKLQLKPVFAIAHFLLHINIHQDLKGILLMTWVITQLNAGVLKRNLALR